MASFNSKGNTVQFQLVNHLTGVPYKLGNGVSAGLFGPGSSMSAVLIDDTGAPYTPSSAVPISGGVAKQGSVVGIILVDPATGLPYKLN